MTDEEYEKEVNEIVKIILKDDGSVEEDLETALTIIKQRRKTTTGLGPVEHLLKRALQKLKTNK